MLKLGEKIHAWPRLFNRLFFFRIKSGKDVFGGACTCSSQIRVMPPGDVTDASVEEREVMDLSIGST